VDLAPYAGPWLFFAEKVNQWESNLQQRRRSARERGDDLPHWVPEALMSEATALYAKIEAALNVDASHRGDVMKVAPTWQWTLKLVEAAKKVDKVVADKPSVSQNSES